jgi:hypothetical protein
MKMEKGQIVAIIILVVFVALIVPSWIYYSNKEIDVRKLGEAAQSACRVEHDTMWKTLDQKTQVTEKHAEIFSEWLETMQEGRKGGTLLKFVTERYPNEAGTALFKDLSAATESMRAKYANAQKELIAIKKEHDALIEKFPGSIFCSGRPKLEIKIVTSTRTEKVYKTGKDDDVELFKKGK